MKFTSYATAALWWLLGSGVDAQGTLLSVLRSRTEFSTFASVAGASPEVTAYLEDTSTSATLFAPVDDAFIALGNGTITKFTDDPTFSRHLTCILEAHVVDGEQLTTATFVNGTVYPSVEGDYNVTIVTDSPNNRLVGQVNEALLIDDVDISASNGVIQTADTVLLPDCAVTSIWEQILANSEFFTTLIEFVERLDLVSVLNNTDGDPSQALTLIAPTDDAFAAVDPTLLATFEEDDALLGGFITYHLVPGSRYLDNLTLIETSYNGNAMNFDTLENGTVQINDASTIVEGSSDILASNGVIHVVDDLALVPPTLETFVAAVPEKFSALEEAFKLFQFTFDPTVDLTLFAPNNEAFDNVTYPFPINDAYSPLIVSVLFGHVVEGSFNSTTIFADENPILSGGAPITVDPAAQTLGEVGAKVVKGDMNVARNSIIHEIDKVLVPASLTKTIYQILEEDPDNRYSLFLTLINMTNFTDLLNRTNEDGMTLFASTNDAFDNLEGFAPGVSAALQDPANADFAGATIAYHMAESNILVPENQLPLNSSGSFNRWGDVMFNVFSGISFQGESFDAVGVSRLSGEVMGTGNGIVHTMMDAILPLSVQEVGSALQRVRGMDLLFYAPRFGRGSAYDSLYYNVSDPMKAVQWTLVYPNNTVFTQERIEKFAPGNNAWDYHASQIIFLHVFPRQYIRSSEFIPGTYNTGGGQINVTVNPMNGVTIGNGRLVESDFFAWNGVAHILDDFVGPDWLGKTILDIIGEIEEASIVSGLLSQSQDIVVALNTTTPQNTMTLFAPVNDAFVALNETLGGSLPPPDQMQNILLYHVYPELVIPEVYNMPFPLPSLAQINATLSNSTEEGLKLNDAILLSDVIYAENGIVFLIDQVLLPEGDTGATSPTALPTSAPQASSPSPTEGKTPSATIPTDSPTAPTSPGTTPSPTTTPASGVTGSSTIIGVALCLTILSGMANHM